MKRRLPGAIVVLLVLASGSVSSALGSTFRVVACGDASGGANHSWVAVSDSSGKLETGNGCGGDGSYAGLYIRDVVGVPNALAGATARWTFDAPSGTTVTSMEYTRWLYKEDDDDWAPVVESGTARLDSCTITYPAVRCASGTEGGSRTSAAVPNAPSISLALRCTATAPTTCSNGGTIHAAVAVLYGATVTLTDLVSPHVVETSGSLLSRAYSTGTQTATFSATDNTGIRSGRIYVDGALAASATYDCDFTYAVPCANRSDAEVSLDTRSLTDGPHSVQVAAVDPAGNETRSSSQEVVVDNNAPAAPDGLSVDGGAAWRDSNSFEVSWSNPADAGSPVASAHYSLCATDGSGCFSEEQTAASDISHLSGISVPSPGAWALRVWLEDAAGNVDSAHTSEVTLRFGSDPATTTSPIIDAPATPAPTADSSAPLTDQLTAPSLDKPATSPAATTVRANPRLRLTSARLSRGRLVLRGRSAAKLPLSLIIRLDNGHLLRRHATVRGGQFKLVVRSRRLTRTSVVTARFAGSTTLAAAGATLRVRG
jgi:hypothetical protein